MADSITPNLTMTAPEVGASTDTWGTKINADLSILDALFGAAGPALLVAKGGTGATTAATARTSLGCGTIATQNANAVALTGGAIDGTPIGQTTPGPVKATNLQFTGVMTFPDATTQITAAGAFTAGSQSISANTTLTVSYQDHMVKASAASGNITVTLFAAAGNLGRRVTVKKMDATANTVTISGSIDGATTQILYRQSDALTLFCDGTGFLIT